MVNSDMPDSITSQEDAQFLNRVNRTEWLRYHGFLRDPFERDATRAEKDTLLDDTSGQETVFVPFPYYEQIKGHDQDTGIPFIFARRGCGKTALRKAIEQSFTQMLGKEGNPQVLVTIHNNFEMVSGDVDEYEIFCSHVEQITCKIISCLLAILNDEEHSVCLDGMRNKKIKKTARKKLRELIRVFPRLRVFFRKEINYEPFFVSKWGFYVMGILSGILSAFVPAAKPVADAIRKIPEDHNKTQRGLPVIELLNSVIELCTEIGFDNVYILIDDVDISYSSDGEDFQESYMKIAPLIVNYQIFDIEGLAIKAFLPSEMMPNWLSSVRIDRLSYVEIDWEKDDIRHLYEKRIQVCRDDDRPNPSVANLCEPGLREVIDENLLQFAFAQQSPRALLCLGNELLTEFFRYERTINDLITFEIWERARQKAEEVL